MTANTISNKDIRTQLENYPYQITYPIRWTDVGANGMLSFVGLGRCFEEARMEFASSRYAAEESAAAAKLSNNWRAFIVRYRVDMLQNIDMQSSLTYGLGIMGIGNSSYTIGLGVFQRGRCVSLSESSAVFVDDDNQPRKMSAQEATSLSSCQIILPETTSLAVRAAPEQLDSQNYAHFEDFSPRFCDTDKIGHLNNVAVSGFYENGLMCFVKSLGFEQKEIQLLFENMSYSDVIYLGEGFFGETIRVCTDVTNINEAGIVLHQALFQNGQCIGVRALLLTPEVLALASKKFEDRLSKSKLASRLFNTNVTN